MKASGLAESGTAKNLEQVDPPCAAARTIVHAMESVSTALRARFRA
jgi:hypothetical protein